MNILVLNAGSSSQKVCLYSLPDDSAAPPPLDPPTPVWKKETEGNGSAADSLPRLIESLWKGPKPILSARSEVHAIGHRVVHGGARFRESVRITGEVKAAIHALAPLAPAHNPAALAGIETADALFGPDTPQFAVFDTAFHRTLPDAAAIYPGPYAWVAEDIRRYGFHGINHQYVAGRAAEMLARDPASLRIISCHLGNGCSLAAIHGGVSIDTTMGFTPLDGLMMGTRSGAVDPGLLIYLLRERKTTAAELDRTLNTESGLKGISSVSGDMREIDATIAAGSSRAQLALDIYIHRLRSGIGAMLASLGGLDVLIFTAGVGEHSATVRAAACEAFGFLGLSIDRATNEDQRSVSDRDIAGVNSRVRVLVIAAQEDWAIARECWSALTAPST